MPRAAAVCGLLLIAAFRAHSVPAVQDAAPASRLEALRVRANGRVLETVTGRRFFYLADTAWELVHRATREEIDWYLETRAAQGFTAVQVVLLPEINGPDMPNAYGQVPLVDRDPDRPNDKYFALVDHIVRAADRHGLYVALLPTWGAYVVSEQHPLFASPRIFDAAGARRYGRYLGARYRAEPNVIWVLGGDRSAGGYEAVWQAMASGLREAGQGAPRKLISYHPNGGESSSRWFASADWIDFHMLQSGHRRDSRPYEMVAEDYARRPVKPVLNGEPGYEGIPDTLSSTGAKLDDEDVRRFAYWSVFSGAFGHTYGANEVWMMWSPALEPLTPKVKPPFLGARRTWRDAVATYPGAQQMRHLRALFDRADRIARVPAQHLLDEPSAGGLHHVAAIAGEDRSWAYVYIPAAAPAPRIRISGLRASRLSARWYNPRTGNEMESLTIEDRVSPLRAVPPDTQDWVLQLE